VLTLVVSAVVIAGSYRATNGQLMVVATGAVLWGVAQLIRGWNMLARGAPAKAGVEKRRRMDKSPAP
jgi:hypothetical protein